MDYTRLRKVKEERWCNYISSKELRRDFKRFPLRAYLCGILRAGVKIIYTHDGLDGNYGGLYKENKYVKGMMFNRFGNLQLLYKYDNYVEHLPPARFGMLLAEKSAARHMREWDIRYSAEIKIKKDLSQEERHITVIHELLHWHLLRLLKNSDWDKNNTWLHRAIEKAFDDEAKRIIEEEPWTLDCILRHADMIYEDGSDKLINCS